MSQASHVSRYRPAVIAVTGVAAAYGIWTLYSAFADHTEKAPLRRSNAVRRSRGLSGGELSVLSEGRTQGAPFGSAVIKRNNLPIRRFVFVKEKVPSPEEWQDQFGDDAEYARVRLAGFALQCFLKIAFLSSEELLHHPEAQQLLTQFGMEDIFNGGATSPAQDVRRYRQQMIEMLGSIDTADFERTLEGFPTDDPQPLNDMNALGRNVAETEVDMLDRNPAAEPAQGLKGLLYYIAEEKAKREAYEHRGIRCDYCNESPIRGIRWHCLNCPDVDLCSTCEASFPHVQTHVFVKVKIPLPAVGQPGRTLSYPVWYPGSSNLVHQPIQPILRKRLAEAHRYEEPQIDALYDQFITTANISYDDDPSQIHLGIDRRAFDRALTIEAWTEHSTPNALYDRMFAFYDRGNKGAILFDDFVDGMAYLRGPTRLQPLKRALQGFDIDGDGFIDRQDFLRLLRAKYDVQKALIAGASGIRVDKLSQDNADVLKSSQPISAIFCEQDMPRGEQRYSGGKQMNDTGDLEPSEGTNVILENNEVPAGTGSLPMNVIRVRSLPQLQRQLARIDRTIRDSDRALDDSNRLGEADREQEMDAVEEQVGSMTDDLSAVEATVLGLGGPRSTAAADNDVSSTRQDVLWKYTEMSYNEALDTIFRAKEQRDSDVSKTSEERRRWREEIENALEQKKAFEESLRAGAELDPLVAAAAHSYDQTSRSSMTNQDTPEQRSAEVQRGIDEQMRDSMLPTDTHSLNQFEKDIQEQSLEELLAAAGYSVDSDESAEQPAAESAAPASPDNAHRQGDDARNQPNGAAVAPNDTAPSQERLEYLASLDKEEEWIEMRGGAGRLSYDELENLASTNREIRGLITGWLELASF